MNKMLFRDVSGDAIGVLIKLVNTLHNKEKRNDLAKLLGQTDAILNDVVDSDLEPLQFSNNIRTKFVIGGFTYAVELVDSQIFVTLPQVPGDQLTTFVAETRSIGQCTKFLRYAALRALGDACSETNESDETNEPDEPGTINFHSDGRA